MILLAGIDFLTTEQGLAHAHCKEANPSPIMQWIAGHPKKHFLVKSIGIGILTGYALTLLSIVTTIVLFLGCLGFGIVQMSNIYQIFIKEDPC